MNRTFPLSHTRERLLSFIYLFGPSLYVLPASLSSSVHLLICNDVGGVQSRPMKKRSLMSLHFDCSHWWSRDSTVDLPSDSPRQEFLDCLGIQRSVNRNPLTLRWPLAYVKVPPGFICGWYRCPSLAPHLTLARRHIFRQIYVNVPLTTVCSTFDAVSACVT